MLSENKIRFAVVGQGHIGKRHAEMILRNPPAPDEREAYLPGGDVRGILVHIYALTMWLAVSWNLPRQSTSNCELVLMIS